MTPPILEIELPSPLCLTLLLAAPAAWAHPERLRNMDLAEQLDGLEAPTSLPRGDWYDASVGAWMFYQQALGGYVTHEPQHPGLYHGGYWVDGLVEMRPVEQVSLNAKLVLVNPAASYGIVTKSRVVPFVHVRFEESPNPDAARPLTARLDLFDLDRQTLGAGLTLQTKEMSGFLATVAQPTAMGDLRLRYVFAGTGGYRVDGDVHAYQLDWGEDALGLLLFHTGHEESDGVFGTDWFSSVYSTKTFGPIAYRAEASRRGEAWAGMLGLGLSARSPWLEVSVGGEARHYGAGYFSWYDGRIQHDYLSIEQLDLPVATSSNFLVSHSEGYLLAADASVRVQTLKGLWLVSDNELVRFDGEAPEGTSGWFYRHGIAYCSRAGVCLDGVLSNKVSAAEALPAVQDVRNVLMFRDVPHIGLDAWFRF